jgi:hypothetical protein
LISTLILICIEATKTDKSRLSGGGGKFADGSLKQNKGDSSSIETANISPEIHTLSEFKPDDIYRATPALGQGSFAVVYKGTVTIKVRYQFYPRTEVIFIIFNRDGRKKKSRSKT